jgi:hypothetical protein
MITNNKSVRAVLAPPVAHMVGDGFRVHNFFPSYEIIGEKGMDPFFLLDYNSRWTVPPSDRQRGVDVHPHRGFETVTISYHGSLAHHDSAGNSGVIHEGDVQWMTAGSGVLHKEYHEKEFSKKGGVFQVVQLWVNLPKKDKLTSPKYQPIKRTDMGSVTLDDGVSIIEVIAGEYEGVKGPASTFSPLNLYNVRLKKTGKSYISFDRTFNTGLLVIEGEVKINDLVIAPLDNYVLFSNNGETFSLEALKDSVLLVMSGKPINEPIASRGPFLMNTEDEIKQAYNDYFAGKFGHLEG